MLRRIRRFFYGLNIKFPKITGKFWLIFAITILVGVLLATVAITGLFAYYSMSLPDPNKVVRRDGLSTIIYDRNGKTLYDVYDGANRIPLEFNQMPDYLKKATIAIEDKEFYKHVGYNPLGILRAFRDLVINRQISGGGSTLTQQLVKNILLSSEQTLPRKIKEVILANEIESKFTKDQILQMYLNEVPYGGSAYGAESASQQYFGKSAKDLTLVESAILAGMPQAPTTYSPFGSYPTAYIDRTKDVLRRMREDGYINYQQENDALKLLTNYKFSSQSGSLKAPHFVFYVKQQLVEKFGEQMVESGGLRVTTTLDYDWQEQAEKIVNEEVKKLKTAKVSNGAAVVLNPKDGEIISMVGSYDYFDKDFGSYNVTTALRQPGSSGKPFIYATALNKGYTASTMLMDVKTGFPSGDVKKPEYTPENYNLKYVGPIQMRFALGNSINTTAVKFTALAGLKEIMQQGYDAGITTWEPTQSNMSQVGLSLALGGREVRLLELADAYSVFANGGYRVDPVAILKVTDNKGKVLYEYHNVAGKKVMPAETSFIISHMLSDNNARKDVFGTNSLLVIPNRTVAVKTGTTDQKRDNWTVGYTPSVVVGVWVGNNDNSVMSPSISSGVTGAAPIWNKIMKYAMTKLPAEEFVKPDSVDAYSIDVLSGGAAHGNDPTRSEYFVKGTEPVDLSPIYKKVKLSVSDSNKLANDLEIKAHQYNEKEFIVISESDPVSESGKNRWQEAIDKWVVDNKKNDAMWNPPTQKSETSDNSVIVRVTNPSDQQRINDHSVSFKAKAYTLRDIVKFTVEVDGNEKINKSSDILDETLSLTDGPHEIKYKATDSAGNTGGATIKIGVNANWDDATPTPTPSP